MTVYDIMHPFHPFSMAVPGPKEAAARAVEVWASRMETELARQQPDEVDIQNSALHLRQGLMLLGLSRVSSEHGDRRRLAQH
jgi:hypothetical protein